MDRRFVSLGSLFAFLGVAIGAFGAHALKDVLDTKGVELWRTAVQYQLVHALGMALVGVIGEQLSRRTITWVGSLFVAGILLFSGSLYALALTDVKVLGAITPLGGVCFLSGWLWLGISVARHKAQKE